MKDILWYCVLSIDDDPICLRELDGLLQKWEKKGFILILFSITNSSSFIQRFVEILH